jgi:hypothetical protein
LTYQFVDWLLRANLKLLGESMAAPRGRSYTPTRGPLAGQTFNAPANARGETAAYNAYQNALARHYGSPTYGALKTQRANPLYTVAFERAKTKGQGRGTAHETARRIVGDTRIEKHKAGKYFETPTGQRMHAIIAQMFDEGLFDSQSDVDDTFYA